MLLENTSHVSRIERPNQIWIVAVFVIALGLRLGWALHQPDNDAAINELPDQREYLELGRNLLGGEGLHFVDPRFADTVYAYRTPGYPLFVAACDGSVKAIRIAQAVIDSSGIIAVWILARRWLGNGRSLFAAALVGVNPFLIYFSGLILSETLFTAMLVWGMVLLTRGKPAAWWSGVVMLALSILVRPSAIALPLILGIFSVFIRPRPRRMPVGAAVTVITIAVLLPWAWRNQRVLGSWIWTTTNGGITLYDGLNSDADGSSDQSFVAAMPQLKTMDELSRSKYLRDLAWDFVRQNPMRTLELAALKVARTWSPVPLSSQYGSDAKHVAVALIYMIPLYLLVVLGVWRGPLPKATKMFLMAPAVYFTLVHAVSVGSLRYRVPADVPMIVIAAAAVHAVRQQNRTEVVNDQMLKE